MEFLNWLANFRSPAGETIFQGFTYLGQEVFAVAVICWLFWCQNKKLGYTLGFTYFSSGLLVQGLKITFRIPRPWVLDPNFQAVPSALPAATGYSFPSGHTQSSTALFSTLGLAARKWQQKLACVMLFLLVGFSRMYLGCHTPKDVLTAMGISLVLSLVVFQVFYKREPAVSHDLRTSLILIAVSLLLAGYSYYLYSAGVIELHYALDCLKASGAGAAFGAGFYIERTKIQFKHPASLPSRILCFLVGIAVTLLIQQGLKPILGENALGSFVRYFLVVLWILAGHPYLITKIFQPDSRQKR